jgi:hypothetical protein
MKKDWQIYALMALAAVAWWFIKVELEDFKTQNKLQWQEAAKTKQCLFEEISKTKERIAFLEGFHEAEKRYRGDKHDK